MSNTNEQIQQLIDDNKVVLFMKGTRMFPQCGFSARSVEIFKRCGVKVKDVNVLADPAIRQGIKDFSNWPTIPQAYIDGKFVGGSDILMEMFESGELHKALGVEDESASATAPKITVSAPARAAFEAALKDAGDEVLRFSVSPSFQYDLYFGPKSGDDFAINCDGLMVHVPKSSAARANGTTIDYVDGPEGAGFKIDNPNEPPRVKNVAPAELKALLDSKAEVTVYDVRGEKERQIAKIADFPALDDAGMATLKGMAKDTKVVLYCHHGVRSRNAGQQLIDQGFTNVHSLTGGIDAWSLQVDSAVPRY